LPRRAARARGRGRRRGARARRARRAARARCGGDPARPVACAAAMTDASPDPSRRTLSEHASKRLLADFGVPIARERIAVDPAAAAREAKALGFPVVAKLCGDAIAHKTERDLVRLGLGSSEAVERAAAELWAKRRPDDGDVSLLVAEQVRGRRELIAGLVRDPQFGPCVLLGLGGILTEALRDVVFALAPLSRDDARRLAEGLRASPLRPQPSRGEPPVGLDALADVLVGLGRLAVERPDVASVDVNPLIVRADGQPVAVDALVELGAADGQPVAVDALVELGA